MSFTFTTEDKAGYSKRMRSTLQIVLLYCLGFVVLGTIISSEMLYAILIAVFIFVVQYIKAERANRHFIKQLNIDNNQVEIHYTIKGQVLEVKGDISDFKFKKKHTINRTATPFLQIQYKNEVVIKQYRIDDWTEEKFNDVIAAI